MYQLTLRGNTDTAHSQDIVPIYFIHSIANQFCPLPECECHTDQAKIAQLFECINNGEMTLREAVDFADGMTI
jgi:hypothetical protein